ncbi:MAG: HAD family hydrolase [Candidatus Lokiarchaeota archaeon]|nr:HAD family hydrolase [Candidatus Lokiarchaeota archaeon]
MKKKALFIDRDGTINEDIGYNFSIERCKILPGVIEGLKVLKEDFKLFIVTNQSGIGLGLTSLEDFKEFNAHILGELANHDIRIERTYYCPHAPDSMCSCRKPRIKHLKEAQKHFNIDLNRSWTIGDHPSDIQFGINAGCKTAYLLTGHGEKHHEQLKELRIVPTVTAHNFLEATQKILEYK